jgi:hypothetical protein
MDAMNPLFEITMGIADYRTVLRWESAVGDATSVVIAMLTWFLRHQLRSSRVADTIKLASDADRLLVEAYETEDDKSWISRYEYRNLMFGCNHCNKRFTRSELLKQHLPNEYASGS